MPEEAGATSVSAAAPTNNVPVIDVHAHYVPALYRQALVDAGRLTLDTIPPPVWKADQALKDMDAMNIGVAILSLSSPGLNWGDNTLAAKLARDANEFGAGVVRDHPKRFGFFASLPLPDVDASLAEIEYAFDTLHADGVGLYSNHNGVYLGDPRFEEVFAELGRRNAVVRVHPVKPAAVPANVLSQLPVPIIEFHFDTTRAIVNLTFAGTLERNPGIKFICPHLGSLLPVLEKRLAGCVHVLKGHGLIPADSQYPDFAAAFANLYYDWASMSFPEVQIPAVLQIGRVERMLCGVDYPFQPVSVAAPELQAQRDTKLVRHQELLGILRNNALRLFPGVAKRLDHHH